MKYTFQCPYGHTVVLTDYSNPPVDGVQCVQCQAKVPFYVRAERKDTVPK